MTAPPPAHPEKQQLIAFGMGRLAPDEATQIEQHLEKCPDCCETILDLKDDTFIGLLRQCELPPFDPDQTNVTLDFASGATAGSLPAVELPRELREHGRYEIQELIGRGGMGDVYKAQHRVMNRPVALKVIRPELVRNSGAVLRFHREVQAAARLHHGNIVAAYDAEQAGDAHYLVMEFVDGVNLDEVIRKSGPLPVEQACDYIRQAAAGLQHAHELGMVHRDIKPHNLMLVRSNRIHAVPAKTQPNESGDYEQGVLKILDFGLAGFATELALEEKNEAADSQATLPESATLQLTQIGAMMGTPDYMAPEQAQNAHTADIRADIYSLGCTFYALLAGRPPFAPRALMEKIKAHAEIEVPSLGEFRSDVPAAVEAVLRKMLAKNPAERYQTPAALLEALKSIEPRPVVVQPGRKRISAALATVAALLVTAIMAAVVVYIQTDYGVVRVEVGDESLQVKLDGKTIEMKDGETPLSIRTGSRTLVVRRGDFTFETDSFQLRRGDVIRLKVQLLPGEVVVLKEGQRFGAKPLGGAGPAPQEMELLAELAGHTNVVRAVRFLPGNEQLVSVDGNGNVIVWDAKAHRIVRRFKVAGETYSDADISADGRLLAVGSDWGTTKGRLQIWDIAKGAALHRTSHKLDYLEQLRFSVDGSKLMAVGSPPVAVLWDVALGTETRTIESGFPSREVKAGVFMPDGTAVVLACTGRVKVFDLATGAAKDEVVLPHDRIVNELVFLPGRLRLAAFQGGGWVSLVDAKSWTVDKTLPSATGELLRSGAIINDELLITGSDQGALQLRKLDGTTQATAKCGAGCCLNVSVSSDARHAVTAGGWLFDSETRKWTVTSDFKLRLWQLPAGGATPAGSNSPSKFFTTLGDMQAIVRKTATDEGLNVLRMNNTEKANSGGPRGEVLLRVELTGEEDRESRIFSGLSSKLKGLAQSSDAFVASLSQNRQGAIDRYHMTYSTAMREGTIQLERSLLGTDKRMPKIRTWTVSVRVEEWPKAEIAGRSERDADMDSTLNWTPLFNGRDLTGWKMHPDKPGNWRVENGVLIGGKLDNGSEEENSFLVTENSDFTDFHLKLEAKLKPGAADTGVLFDFADGSWAEANIAFDPSKRDQYVGSIMVAGTKLNGVTWQAAPRDLASPDQWFTLEVIAVGRQITTKVNGKIAVVHTQRKKTTGPIRLQDHGPFTVAEFRKIEIIALDEQGKPLHQPTSPEAAPLTIGMNDEFGMLFEGRLVAPAELSRLLRDALKNNPDRVVAIDLPKKKWTVSGHVDQLEQIGRTVGAMHITRPAWSEIRIVLSVVNSSMQVLDINGPGYSATGFFQSHLPNVREVVAKNPDLPVLLDVAQDIDLGDPKITEGLEEVRRVAEEAGAKVRIGRTLPGKANPETSESIQLTKTLPGHRLAGGGQCISLSQDGTALASCGSDGARIWEMPSGKLTAHLPPQKSGATNIALSPNGKLVAISEYNVKTIFLWELPVGKLVGTLPTELENVVRLQFSPDGKWLAEAGANAVGIWDLEQNKLVNQFKAEKYFGPICFTPDGKSVLVGANRMVWEIESGKSTSPLPAGPGLRAVRLSSAGTVLAGAVDKEILIWDVRNGRQLAALVGHTDGVESIHFLPGELHIISGSHDGSIRIWDVQTGKEVARREGLQHLANHVLPLPDGRSAVSFGFWYLQAKPDAATSDWSIQVWRLPGGMQPPPQPEKINLLRELPGSKEWITAVAYPENDRAVTVAVDGVVRVWENGGAELESHQLPFGGQADISPDGRLVVVASASNDKDMATVALWELDTWKERWKIDVPTTTTKFTPKFLVDVRFAPNDRVIVRSSVDAGIAIVDATNGKILSRFPKKGPAMGAASQSPDGKRLFVRQMAPAPFGRINRIEDGAELARIDTRDVVLDAVWSRDGAALILAESTLSEGRIAVFDASTGKLVRRWVAEPKGIESLALGQGNLLATGGLSRIAVWDWSTGKLLAAIDSPKQDGDSRLAIAISPDGKQLISGGARWLAGEDRLPRLWQLPQSVWPK